MSSALLAKLKIKPTPQLKIPIEISIPIPEERKNIQVKTTIIDKSKDSFFDRDLFFRDVVEKYTGKDKEQTIVSEIEPLEPVSAPEKVVKKNLGKVKLKIVEKQPQLQLQEEEEKEEEGTETPEKKEKLSLEKRLTKPPIGVIKEGPVSLLKIGTETIGTRVDKDKQIIVSASSYYMNNRQIFINFMSSLFSKYKEELVIESEADTSCSKRSEGFSLMTHQKIVRDYLSLYTPYRGLLLYHGLGSGKTCSSIAIAEGLKTNKQIVIMTPASLRMNYIEELKKCGDSLYRKTQFWEFISIKEREELVESLSKVLSLSVEYIKKQNGAWLVNVKKSPNFDTLTSLEKVSLDNQLNEMIRYKYKFISYNGLRKSHLETLTNNFKENPFDNKVVIIDEAHNFVSRIVNKVGKKKTDSLSMQLYEYLMTSQNARIVLLTGTPIINYPNELGILFNILRGKIKTWHFKLTISSDKKVSEEYLKKLLTLNGSSMDYLEYKPTSTTLTITRNPFGFINQIKNNDYEGVSSDERGNIDDAPFIKFITNTLKTQGISIQPRGIKLDAYKALPDTLDDFKKYFIDDKNEVKNMIMFNRRILGLTSYFRSAQEGLMPKFEKSTDFIIVKNEMSPFQFGIYEEARSSERKLEMNNAKKKAKKKGKENDIYDDTSSTYRIFSRLFCNFVFPRPMITRPMPSGDTLENTIMNENNDEDVVDITSDEDKIANIDGKYEADEVYTEDDGETREEKKDEIFVEPKRSKKDMKQAYEKAINFSLKKLDENKQKYLTPEALQIYSPKFLSILENVKDSSHKGLHLIYSQFRTLEGIGILKVILEANGFVQFKLVKEREKWNIDIREEDKGKPTFALYTGTESSEEKEMVRNIFNGNWKYIPTEISEQLQEQSLNNMYGEIIKVFMITASGAEGISLENVRYVHITEPYWHPVRTQQVIGRARRICSHQYLPKELRTVTVFLYLMILSEEQKKSDESIELRLKDKSKRDNKTPVTTDEALYEIATIKEEISEKLLQSVKESAIDCALHSKFGAKEQLQCFSFGSPSSDRYAYIPSFADEEPDVVAAKNRIELKWKGVEVTIDGIKYALNRQNNNVYDFDSYLRGQPVQIGVLKISGTEKKETYKLERI